MASADLELPWDTLSVGATRPAVVGTLNVPFWALLPIIGVPMLIVSATALMGSPNPWWLALIFPFTALGRWIIARDHNRPRVLFLALISGSLFADRGEWGGYTVDPLGVARRRIRAAGRRAREIGREA